MGSGIEGLGIYILNFTKGIWDYLKKKIKRNQREVQTLSGFENLSITMDNRRGPRVAGIHQDNGKKMEKNIKKVQTEELATNKKPFLWNSTAHYQKSLRTDVIILLSFGHLDFLFGIIPPASVNFSIF